MVSRVVFCCIAALALILARGSLAQPAEDRVAVIIGNANYPGPAALKNPLSDATAIERELRKLGFETYTFRDIGSKDLAEVRQTLEKRVRRNTVLFFYYAGHGMQIDGRNYLIPIDTRMTSVDLIADDSLYLGDILASIEKRRPRLATVILDACRDNPFKTDPKGPQLTKGLARVDPPSSTVVFYATRPGGVAADGTGDNGLFTQSLLEEIQKPEQPIEVIFRRTSTRVFESSKSEQEPWVEGVIRQEFFLSRIPNTAVPPAPPAPALAEATTGTTLTPPSPAQPEKRELLTLTSEAIKGRRRDLKASAGKEEKTSYICDKDGCYDYGQWASLLNEQPNLERLNSHLSKMAASKSAAVCVFDIEQDRCTGATPRLRIIYPLIFTRPTTFRGYDFDEIRVSKNGGLSFDVKPIFYAGETRRDGCLVSDGNLMFSLERVTLDISRHTCFNVVIPATIKNSFQVLYADLAKGEIVARWDLGMISFLATGSGSDVIKISF
jgi:uncharacterized caspase-like protein